MRYGSVEDGMGRGEEGWGGRMGELCQSQSRGIRRKMRGWRVRLSMNCSRKGWWPGWRGSSTFVLRFGRGAREGWGLALWITVQLITNCNSFSYTMFVYSLNVLCQSCCRFFYRFCDVTSTLIKPHIYVSNSSRRRESVRRSVNSVRANIFH